MLPDKQPILGRHAHDCYYLAGCVCFRIGSPRAFVACYASDSAWAASLRTRLLVDPCALKHIVRVERHGFKLRLTPVESKLDQVRPKPRIRRVDGAVELCLVVSEETAIEKNLKASLFRPSIPIILSASVWLPDCRHAKNCNRKGIRRNRGPRWPCRMHTLSRHRPETPSFRRRCNPGTRASLSHTPTESRQQIEARTPSCLGSNTSRTIPRLLRERLPHRHRLHQAQGDCAGRLGEAITITQTQRHWASWAPGRELRPRTAFPIRSQLTQIDFCSVLSCTIW